MIEFKSLRAKIIGLLLLVAAVNLVFGVFLIFNLRTIEDKFETITASEFGRIHAIQQALVSLDRSSSSLAFGLTYEDLKDLSNLNESQGDFKKAVLDFDMFISALIWGSESDAFKGLEGGILATEWSRSGNSEKYAISKSEHQEQQLAGQANIIFGAFEKRAQEAFSLKTKILRLSADLDSSESVALKAELKVLLGEVKNLKFRIDGLMLELIESTEVTNQVEIQKYNYQIVLVRNTAILVMFSSVILAFVLGSYFFYKQIIDPITKLESEAEKISSGDFTHTIELDKEDELGGLAKSVNKMAASLRKYYSELEAKYGKHTEEINIAKIDLEDQQKALMNLLEDVSEEKELEESQSETLLGSIGEGIVLTNDEGKVTYVNKAFERLLGYKSSELEGKVIAEALKAYSMTGKKIPPKERSDAAMVTASKQETKLDMLTKSGEKVSLVVYATPVKVREEYKGVVRVFHNISDDVKLQRQKDDFFSIASHELRTPLTVIAGNLDIILQGYGKSKISVADKDLLSDSISAADRLIKMVKDFLNVSRLDQGRLKYELAAVDACNVTDSVVKELLPLAEGKNLYLKYECASKHPKIMTDDSLFREILINLIGNAIKFTSKGGITVSHELLNDTLLLRVTDTGSGIPSDMHDILFQRFQQAMSRTLSRQAGGTGLGLYISREFARVMKGDLVLEESKLNVGSKFLATFPIVSRKK